MSRCTAPEPSPFTPQERDLIRRELCQHFGQDPRVADGLLLRTWRSGPQAGQPKLPSAVQSMLARSLVEIRTGRGPRAVFTSTGLAALRQALGYIKKADAGISPAWRPLVCECSPSPVMRSHLDLSASPRSSAVAR